MCSLNLTIVFNPLDNSGQALCIKPCHEDLILTRKSHNWAGIAFIQGDSAGGSKLIEQTLYSIQAFKLSLVRPVVTGSSFMCNLNSNVGKRNQYVQIIHQLKGLDESLPKMQFSFKLSN